MIDLNARANQAWRDLADARAADPLVLELGSPQLTYVVGWAAGFETAAKEIAAAFEPALYNSPDGDDFAHTHPPEEGEPECPACWVQHIRQILARSVVMKWRDS